MSKLTGPEIARQVRLGNLIIEPFNGNRLGPNSYDVTLGPNIATYRNASLDCKREITEADLYRWTIPSDGLELVPGVGYIGHTNEVCGVSPHSPTGYVPCLEGKSGIGRLFIQVHATAGFGDDGFIGDWTLELTVTHPVRVYAGQLIGQVYFEPTIGERAPYAGSYQNQRGPVASQLWLSFLKEKI